MHNKLDKIQQKSTFEMKFDEWAIHFSVVCMVTVVPLGEIEAIRLTKWDKDWKINVQLWTPTIVLKQSCMLLHSIGLSPVLAMLYA